jgi:hypothetical protein
MMRGSGLASQMGQWWDSDESYNSSNLGQDGNNRQFFEAAMTEKLVYWMLPHDGTETGYVGWKDVTLDRLNRTKVYCLSA